MTLAHNSKYSKTNQDDGHQNADQRHWQRDAEQIGHSQNDSDRNQVSGAKRQERT